MALDTSIYGNLQPIAPQINPLAQMAQVAQLQAAQYGIGKAQRDEERQNRLYGVMQSAEFQQGDATTRQRLAYGAGDVDAASKIATSAAAVNKDTREAEKSQFALAKERFNMVGQVIGSVQDQPSYERALKQLQTLGIEAPNAPPQYDPNIVRQFAEQTRTAQEKELAKLQQTGQAETGRHNLATEGLTAQGQTMTDARARDLNAINKGDAGTKASTDVRKEFNALAEVKNYQQALPAFKAIEDAATRSNPQADINLVYGLAKLYDPTSVVREGEYATVASAQAIPEQVKKWALYLQGGGKLTPETKKQILEESRGRMGTYQTEYEAKRDQYGDIATRTGADPTLVLDKGYDKPVKPRKSIGGVTYENDGKGWYPMGSK